MDSYAIGTYTFEMCSSVSFPLSEKGIIEIERFTSGKTHANLY